MTVMGNKSFGLGRTVSLANSHIGHSVCANPGRRGFRIHQSHVHQTDRLHGVRYEALRPAPDEAPICSLALG